MEKLAHERAISIIIQSEVSRLEDIRESNSLVCAGNHDRIQNLVLRKVDLLCLSFSMVLNSDRTSSSAVGSAGMENRRIENKKLLIITHYNV